MKQLSILLIIVLSGFGSKGQQWLWAREAKYLPFASFGEGKTAIGPTGDIFTAGYFEGTIQFDNTTLVEQDGDLDLYLARYNSCSMHVEFIR